MRGRIPLDSDMFFGRAHEIRRIEDKLAGDTPQCVSIIGERRIGKSSLAFRIFGKIKSSENTLALYLDCDGLTEDCQSKDNFFGFLCEEFLGFNKNKTKIKEMQGFGKKKPFNNYESFRVFVRNTGERGIKTIIFMDEFEHLPNKKFADSTFFSNLRALATNPENHLAFVTISQTPLYELTHTHKSIKYSKFWNIFYTEVIGLLPHKKIEQLRKYGLEKTNIPFTVAEIEKIHHYAGDFPFFNQVACGFIWNFKRDEGGMDWDKLDVDIFPYYKKIWEDRTKEEQKLLKKTVELKKDFTHQNLLTRGIIIKENERCTPFSTHFSQLIKKKFIIKRKKITLNKVIAIANRIANIFKKG